MEAARTPSRLNNPMAVGISPDIFIAGVRLKGNSAVWTSESHMVRHSRSKDVSMTKSFQESQIRLIPYLKTAGFTFTAARPLRVRVPSDEG